MVCERENLKFATDNTAMQVFATDRFCPCTDILMTSVQRPINVWTKPSSGALFKFLGGGGRAMECSGVRRGGTQGDLVGH